MASGDAARMRDGRWAMETGVGVKLGRMVLRKSKFKHRGLEGEAVCTLVKRKS